MMVDCKRRRVLVVDDHAAKRYLAASALKEAGYVTLEAGSGEEALRTIDAQLPDLVVLDGRMPRMSGLELLQRLKADPRSSQIPVVLVSLLFLDEDFASTALTAGAAEVLAAPESIHLVHAVQRVLRAPT
jgi:CheY-like chemotaxis protein